MMNIVKTAAVYVIGAAAIVYGLIVWLLFGLRARVPEPEPVRYYELRKSPRAD